jgi:hypothetical protein
MRISLDGKSITQREIEMPPAPNPRTFGSTGTGLAAHSLELTAEGGDLACAMQTPQMRARISPLTGAQSKCC